MSEIERACGNCKHWGEAYVGRVHIHPSLSHCNVCTHYTNSDASTLWIVPITHWCGEFEARTDEEARDE